MEPRVCGSQPREATTSSSSTSCFPGRNGYQICADLREAGDWTPILMLTAKDGDLDEAEALETGADDYLTKPFSFPVLVARIRALLRRATGRNPIPVEVGDLRIDPGQRRAWRGDVEIKLTSRQFDVLEFLVRRAGQVLSKAEILNGVWEYDFEGDPNIVEVYIRRFAPGSTSLSDAGRSKPSGVPAIASRPTDNERSSIRSRITILAAFSVAVVLVLASIGLVAIHRRQLTDNVDAALTQRAR